MVDIEHPKQEEELDGSESDRRQWYVVSEEPQHMRVMRSLLLAPRFARKSSRRPADGSRDARNDLSTSTSGRPILGDRAVLVRPGQLIILLDGGVARPIRVELLPNAEIF